MLIGEFIFSYPVWKKVSFVILVCLTVSIFYFGKILALDKYSFEIELAQKLSEDFRERVEGDIWNTEPNPGSGILATVESRLAEDPFWQLAMFLRWFWVAFMVLAFPYVRYKPAVQNT